MEQLTISSINVEDMADHMATVVNEAIKDIEEIQRTNPVVEFNLGRGKDNKLILVATVNFPDDNTISPMQYAERLVSAELIKMVVSKKMKSDH